MKSFLYSFMVTLLIGTLISLVFITPKVFYVERNIKNLSNDLSRLNESQKEKYLFHQGGMAFDTDMEIMASSFGVSPEVLKSHPMLNSSNYPEMVASFSGRLSYWLAISDISIDAYFKNNPDAEYLEFGRLTEDSVEWEMIYPLIDDDSL